MNNNNPSTSGNVLGYLPPYFLYKNDFSLIMLRMKYEQETSLLGSQPNTFFLDQWLVILSWHKKYVKQPFNVKLENNKHL